MMTIAIPDGGVADLLAAAQRYKASFLLLDENHPKGLADLYTNPTSLPGLDFLGMYEDTRIWRIDNNRN
jgi:hypothetical protein